MISPNLMKYVESFEVYSKHNYQMARVTKNDEEITVTRSDHYTIIFKMKNIPLNGKNLSITGKHTGWNLRKEGGWEKYKELTEKLDDDIIKSDEYIDEAYHKLDKAHTKIKFSSFGKVKKKRNYGDEKLNELSRRKANTNDETMRKNIDDEIANRTMEVKKARFEKELDVLKKSSTTTSVFKLKQKIVGFKKESLEAVAVIDPVSKNLATTKDEI